MALELRLSSGCGCAAGVLQAEKPCAAMIGGRRQAATAAPKAHHPMDGRYYNRLNLEISVDRLCLLKSSAVMDSDAIFATRPLGERATHPIARRSTCPALLLVLAGDGPASSILSPGPSPLRGEGSRLPSLPQAGESWREGWRRAEQADHRTLGRVQLRFLG